MVGREVLLRVEKPPAKPGATVLSVRRPLASAAATVRGALDNVSFDVRAGEIVGIAGVEGNGQTELIEALAGLLPASQVSGTVAFDGRDIASARRAAAPRGGHRARPRRPSPARPAARIQPC